MPYTNNPTTRPVDAVRLLIGDIYQDIELLGDTEYEYYLSKNSGNINRASVDAARSIMFVLSRWTRERTGDIEVYGSEWAKAYRQALLDYVKNPNLSIFNAMPYAGGISKADMQANNDNSDNVRSSFYLGMANDSPTFQEGGEKPLDEF